MIFSVHSVALGNPFSFNSFTTGSQPTNENFSPAPNLYQTSMDRFVNGERSKSDLPDLISSVENTNFCERIYKLQQKTNVNSNAAKVIHDEIDSLLAGRNISTGGHITRYLDAYDDAGEFNRKCIELIVASPVVAELKALGNVAALNTFSENRPSPQDDLPTTKINSPCCTSGICISSEFMETCNEFETSPVQMEGLENIGNIAQMMKIYVNSEKSVELTLQKGTENFCNNCYQKTAVSLAGNADKFQEDRRKYLDKIKEKVAQFNTTKSFKKLQLFNEAVAGSLIFNSLTGKEKQPSICRFDSNKFEEIVKNDKCGALKVKHGGEKFDSIMSERKKIAINTMYGKDLDKDFDAYVDFMDGKFTDTQCTNAGKHAIYKAAMYHSTDGYSTDFTRMLGLLESDRAASNKLKTDCSQSNNLNPITYVKEELYTRISSVLERKHRGGENNIRLHLHPETEKRIEDQYQALQGDDDEKFKNYINSYVDQAINYDPRFALLLSSGDTFCEVLKEEGILNKFPDEIFNTSDDGPGALSNRFSKTQDSVNNSCEKIYADIEKSICSDTDTLNPTEADVVKFAPLVKKESENISNIEMIALNSAICKLASNDSIVGATQFDQQTSPLDSMLDSREKLMENATQDEKVYLDYNRFASTSLNIKDGECKGPSERKHLFAIHTMFGIDETSEEFKSGLENTSVRAALGKAGNTDNAEISVSTSDVANLESIETAGGFDPIDDSDGSLSSTNNNPVQRELGRNNAKSANEMGILENNNTVGFSGSGPSSVGSGTSTVSTSTNSVSSNFMDRLDKIVTGSTAASTTTSTTQVRERKFPLAEPISSAEIREIKQENPAITQKIEEIKRDLSEENISGEKLDEYLEGRDANLPATVANSDLRAEIEKLKAQIQAQALNSRTSGNESELRDKLSEAEARISELDTAMQTVQSRNAASTSNNSESLQNLVGSQVGSSGEGRIPASISEREQSSSISQGVGNIRAGSSLKTKRLPNEFFEADTYGETLKLEMSKDSELILSVEGSWYEFVEPINRNSLQISNGRVVGIKILDKTIEVSKFSDEQRQIINGFAGEDFIKLSEEKSLLEKIVVPALRRNIASVEDTSAVIPTGVTYQQLLDFNNPSE